MPILPFSSGISKAIADSLYRGPAVSEFEVIVPTQAAVTAAINAAHGAYTYVVSGITTLPTVGTTYTTYGYTYTITQVNLTGSPGSYAGTIVATGSFSPAEFGTLTLGSGTGDATITYTSFLTGVGIVKVCAGQIACTAAVPATATTTACAFPWYQGVSIEGAGRVYQVFTNHQVGSAAPDGEWALRGGTVFVGDGTFDCFALNSIDQAAVPAAGMLSTAIQDCGFRNLGFDSFSNAFNLGGANVYGPLYCDFEELYFRNCTQWAMRLTNSMHSQFRRVRAVNCANGFLIRDAIPSAGYILLGHNKFEDIWYQCARFNPTVTANTTAVLSVSLADAQYLANNFPVYVTTTTLGFTAFQTLYVVNLNKTTGAFGLSLTVGGSAIAATGNGTMVIKGANNLSRGFVWSCDTVNGAVQATQVGKGIKTLMQSRDHKIAQTATVTTNTISAATNANPVSFTTGGAHGYTSGQVIAISGFTSNWTPCNGGFVVTVTGASTFTIPVDSTTFGAMTGTPIIGQITVPDGSQFIPYMPVYFSLAVDGFTANQVYLTQYVAGNTMVFGNSMSSASIVPTGTTNLPIASNGCACMEFTCGPGTTGCTNNQMDMTGVDIEGTATCGLYIENSGNFRFAIEENVTTGAVPGGNIADVCLRNANSGVIDCFGGGAHDIDTSSAGVQFYGNFSTAVQKQGVGLGYNGALLCNELHINGGGTNFPLFDVQSRLGAQFNYPGIPWGQYYYSNSAQNQTMGGIQMGDHYYNRGSAGTRILPYLTTDSTPGSSALGGVVRFVNGCNFPLVILSQSVASVSGLSTAPVVGDTYSTPSSNSQAIITVTAVNVTGVSPNIAGTVNVAVGPTAGNLAGFTNLIGSSGTWTRVSGTGPGSLPYTGYLGQLFNNLNIGAATNLQGPTWYVMPPYSTLECAAGFDSSSVYCWSLSPGTAMGSGPPIGVVAQNTLLAKTATVSTVTTYTPPIACSLEIVCSLSIVSSTASSVTLTVTYTDENNSAQTLTIYPGGSLTAAVGPTTGPYAFIPVLIRSKASTAVTVVATCSATPTINYDVHAEIWFSSL